MRIFLAEDERSLARALVSILEEKGCTVDAVHDGSLALQAARSGGYDVIVLDIMMPGMDGITLLRHLRKGGDHTPVLIISARAEVEDRIQGLDGGADDYLTKPFDPMELWARIRALSRRHGSLQESVLSVGNLKLNRATHELSSPDGNYRLTNKEFQLLELLMEQPQRLVTIDRFRRAVWLSEPDPDPSVIWTYISYLRKKLKALDANVHIRANRNAGYTLEVQDAP